MECLYACLAEGIPAGSYLSDCAVDTPNEACEDRDGALRKALWAQSEKLVAEAGLALPERLLAEREAAPVVATRFLKVDHLLNQPPPSCVRCGGMLVNEGSVSDPRQVCFVGVKSKGGGPVPQVFPLHIISNGLLPQKTAQQRRRAAKKQRLRDKLRNTGDLLAPGDVQISISTAMSSSPSSKCEGLAPSGQAFVGSTRTPSLQSPFLSAPSLLP